MESLNEYISKYKKQLDKGAIQKAYQGLMAYIMDLKTQLSKRYPDLAPGNLYQGYMDMTYFPVFPKSLKSLKLKIAIVFIHETIKFEVWLTGYNKQIQTKYWKLFQAGDWNKYRMPATTRGVDSIIEHTLVDQPDFSDLDALTKRLEKGILTFIDDIEIFLSKH
jgi:hypothetical protein